MRSPTGACLEPPGDRVYLVVDVRQSGAIEDAGRRITNALQRQPQTARRFVTAFVTATVRGLADARKQGEWTLQDPDDLPKTDISGGPCEEVPASFASPALYETFPLQLEEDLVQELLRDPFRGRNIVDHDGSRAGPVREGQGAAVGLGDLAAEDQADAGASRLRREERHEQVRRGRKAGAVVVHADLESGRRLVHQRPGEANAAAGRFRGLDAVLGQVDQELLELVRRQRRSPGLLLMAEWALQKGT